MKLARPKLGLLIEIVLIDAKNYDNAKLPNKIR